MRFPKQDITEPETCGSKMVICSTQTIKNDVDGIFLRNILLIKAFIPVRGLQYYIWARSIAMTLCSLQEPGRWSWVIREVQLTWITTWLLSPFGFSSILF